MARGVEDAPEGLRPGWDAKDARTIRAMLWAGGLAIGLCGILAIMAR